MFLQTFSDANTWMIVTGSPRCNNTPVYNADQTSYNTRVAGKDPGRKRKLNSVDMVFDEEPKRKKRRMNSQVTCPTSCTNEAMFKPVCVSEGSEMMRRKRMKKSVTNVRKRKPSGFDDEPDRKKRRTGCCESDKNGKRVDSFDLCQSQRVKEQMFSSHQVACPPVNEQVFYTSSVQHNNPVSPASTGLKTTSNILMQVFGAFYKGWSLADAFKKLFSLISPDQHQIGKDQTVPSQNETSSKDSNTWMSVTGSPLCDNTTVHNAHIDQTSSDTRVAGKDPGRKRKLDSVEIVFDEEPKRKKRKMNSQVFCPRSCTNEVMFRPVCVGEGSAMRQKRTKEVTNVRKRKCSSFDEEPEKKRRRTGYFASDKNGKRVDGFDLCQSQRGKEEMFSSHQVAWPSVNKQVFYTSLVQHYNPVSPASTDLKIESNIVMQFEGIGAIYKGRFFADGFKAEHMHRTAQVFLHNLKNMTKSNTLHQTASSQPETSSKDAKAWLNVTCSKNCDNTLVYNADQTSATSGKYPGRKKRVLKAVEIVSGEQSTMFEMVSAEESNTVAMMSVEKSNTIAMMSVEKSNTIAMVSVEKSNTVEMVSVEKSNTVEMLSVGKSNTIEMVSVGKSIEMVSVEKSNTVEMLSVGKSNGVEMVSVGKSNTVAMVSVEKSNTVEMLSDVKSNTIATVSVQKLNTIEMVSEKETTTFEMMSLRRSSTFEMVSVEEPITGDVVSAEEPNTVKILKNVMIVSNKEPKKKKKLKNDPDKKHKNVNMVFNQPIEKQLSFPQAAARSILNGIKLGKKLGQGGFGIVYEGKRLSDGREVAVKFCRKWNKMKYITVPELPTPVPSEIGLLLIVNDEPKVPEMIELLDWEDKDGCYIMVFERPTPCKDMVKFVIDHGGVLTEALAWIVMWQTIHAAQVCCARGVFHSDIKMENLLVQTETFHVKLIDFGCGRILKDSAYCEFSGTLQYCPPEFFMTGWYHGKSATVWSLGVLLFVILCGRFPTTSEMKQIDSGTWPHSCLSYECFHLIHRLLQLNPLRRISLEEIIIHPWFKGQTLQLDKKSLQSLKRVLPVRSPQEKSCDQISTKCIAPTKPKICVN